MRSLLLSMLFAILATAAPAPRSDAPEFGANGILTTDDLKTVAFKSRVLRTADELKELKLKSGSRPEDYDVAVHLPRTKFKPGEPVPVYFVVKNKLDRKIGLKMLIDFSGHAPHLRGECTFSIRAINPTKPIEMEVMHSTRYSEDTLVDVPANGFHVARGDLNRLGDASLPPGEYEVEWSCQLRASAPVKFTVLPGEASAPRPKARGERFRFVAIEPDDPEAGDEDRFLWKDFGMEPIDVDRMSASLRSGPFGKYIPDASTIPASDGHIHARASLRREKDVETLVVALTSTDPRKEVSFNEVPRLYLQVEEREPGGRGAKSERSLRDQLRRAEPRFKTPMTIEVPFDAEQWKEADFGRGRLAVIVTSGKLEFPVRGKHQVELMLESSRVALDEKAWTGLVRSEFIPLNK